jgi:hypothetical protein
MAIDGIRGPGGFGVQRQGVEQHEGDSSLVCENRGAAAIAAGNIGRLGMGWSWQSDMLTCTVN